MNTIAGPLLKLLGYGHLFNLTGEQTAEQSAAQLMVLPEWIKKHNEEALVKSMKALNENVNVTSMLINHPKLLLRRK